MMNEPILSALIGLCGACENNGKTENTDTVVLKALLTCLSEEAEDDVIADILKEKYTISPSCKTCPTPCGKTSDFDMTRFYKNNSLVEVKKDLLLETVALARRLDTTKKMDLPLEIYRAISYLSYDLSKDSYADLIKTLQTMS